MERFTQVIKRGSGTLVDVKMCDPNDGETWRERVYDHEKNYNAYMQLAKYEDLQEQCLKELNCTLEELKDKCVEYLNHLPLIEKERLHHLSLIEKERLYVGTWGKAVEEMEQE